MKSIICFVLLFGSYLSIAQTSKRLDSLLTISKRQTEIPLIKTLNEIAWEYRNSNVDTSILYANKALEEAERIQNEKSVASAYNSLAAAYEAKSMLDSAQIYHSKSLELKLKTKDTVGSGDSYNNLGIVYDTKGDFSLALEHYFKALDIYEKYAKSFDKVPMVLVNIGIVYKKQKEYDKVYDYYKRALKIYQDNDYEIGEVITLGNIGSILLNLEDYKTSITYSEKAKAQYKTLGYSRYEPYMQFNIAIAKDSLGDYEGARKDYIESIEAFENDQNVYELANAKRSLASNYLRNKEYRKAIHNLDEALHDIEGKSFYELEVKLFKSLAKAKAKVGDFKQAFDYYEKYAVGHDSLFEKEKTQTVFELEKKYQTEKKEKEILSQRADLAEQKLDISEKNIQLLGFGVLTVVLALLGYLFFNQQKLKNRQLQKENELKDALVKIETQSRLQEQRLRISRDLHDNVGAQLTFIISSLDNLKYGFKLPEKLGSKLQTISAFTSATIYELRDTIWAMNKSEVSLEDLQSRISNFIEKADTASDGIDFNFNSKTSEMEHIKFSSVEGMNMYRIIQESINNALKYADAKHITVDFSAEENKLVFKVSDDGKGFDIKNAPLGNGINNMKKRAQDIGANIEITSEVKKGTTITLLKSKM